MNDKRIQEDFNPSMHIIPLDRENRSPVILTGEPESDNTLVAITDNGRISFFPIEAEAVYMDGERIGRTFPLLQDISNRIEERFPHEQDMYGNHVDQFLAVGVMYGRKGKEVKFIFEVWGFLEHFGELDVIYSKLNSLHGTTVGDKEYTEIEKYLSGEPVRNWLNQLIAFLKAELGWSNHVRQALDDPVSDGNEDSIYAISFGGGDFKVSARSDYSLYCLNSKCQPCVIVVPKPSYQLLDLMITEYANKHDAAVTIGCKMIETEAPLFMPVAMSVSNYERYFVPLSEFIMNKLFPPRELAEQFLKNIEFVEGDEYKLNIKLIRLGKNLKKGDLFTRDKQGNRVEIYVTHLLKMEKPYSLKEIYEVKWRHLFGGSR
jgi:hypothetical protein